MIKVADELITAASIDRGIPAVVEAFDARFEVAFPVPSSYKSLYTKAMDSFSKSVTASLLGGVGYFYGTSIVNKGFSYEWDQSDEDSVGPNADAADTATLTEPRSLLTATPSRSFFPRGFYWYVCLHKIEMKSLTGYVLIGMKASI